jgi:hypothetical protein
MSAQIPYTIGIMCVAVMRQMYLTFCLNWDHYFGWFIYVPVSVEPNSVTPLFFKARIVVYNKKRIRRIYVPVSVATCMLKTNYIYE